MDNTTSTNEKPLRAGQKWTPEENERLMQRVMKGRTIEDVAKKHHRTTNAIRLRMLDNAMQMVQNGCTMDDVCCRLFLVKDELEIHISRRTSDDKLKQNIETPQKRFNKKMTCKVCDLLRQQLLEKDKHIAWLLTQVSKHTSVEPQEANIIDM
jgi:hypothetical protein